MQPKRNAKLQRSRGFTLIEMLVALVILAVASVAIYGRSGQAVSALYSLEQRSLANWIAQDHMTKLRLQQRRLRLEATEPDQIPLVEAGGESEEIFTAGRLWSIDVDISDTDLETMKRVEIEVAVVSEEAGRSDPIVTAVGFLGQY